MVDELFSYGVTLNIALLVQGRELVCCEVSFIVSYVIIILNACVEMC